MENQRIFETCTGLFRICDYSSPFLDSRGEGYPTRAAAYRAIIEYAEQSGEELPEIIVGEISPKTLRQAGYKVSRIGKSTYLAKRRST